nr:AbiH family protein [uncultured Chryseobacterium sp.]
MNKIVLIGNGFDLAHGMKTSYNDFIDDFESEIKNTFYHRPLNYNESDDYSDVSVNESSKYYEPSNYGFKKDLSAFKFNNIFFEYVLNRFKAVNYYDLEGFFYDMLKVANVNTIAKLNSDFYSFINHLEKYLTKVEAQFKEGVSNIISEISEHIYDPILFNELSQEAKRSLARKYDAWSTNEACRKVAAERIYGDFKKANKNFNSETTLLLNFNYTETADLYKKEKTQIINIHGKLNNIENPIIFGYGDELDSQYSIIENMNDNRFLEHFKSINYAKTDNYKQVLEYIDSDLFQICIMGHSCGNTDRTLLNTIFEHNNCASVKIYYHQKSATQNNYLDIYKNISRNFNNKAKLRDRVVNQSFCEQLIGFTETN